MDPVQIVTVGGAAGALWWVLNLLVGGKLHTHSEVAGLRQDNTDLKKVNRTQADALKASNELLPEILKLLRERRDADRG